MGVEGRGEAPGRQDGEDAARESAASGLRARDGGRPQVPGQGGPVETREGRTGPGAARSDGAAESSGDEAPPGVPQQRESGPSEDGEPSDSALMRRMRRGDVEAYETLYRRHATAVRRYAGTCCRDAHTAEDLTNEVFARTLQAVRAGAGPDTAVRAYLLTSVRRVAAAWARTAKREQLVEDFAVFAQSAAGAAAASGGAPGPDEDTLSLGADVRAMQEADRAMVVRAFRALPEKYQAVLWHTAVEEESPKQVAPLLGLTVGATAVLAHRAREKLKQAYLQAHVQHATAAGGDCARHADRLGAYARGGLRMRAERGLRKHLEDCASCRTAALEVRDLNAQIRLLLPVAFLGWFGGGGGAKALGLLTGGGAAGAVSGAGAAASAGGSAGAGGAAGGAGAGGAVSEGVGVPVKIGVAAGVATAAGVACALVLVGADGPAPAPQSRPSVAPADPAPSAPGHGPEPGAPPPPAPAPAPSSNAPAPPKRKPAPEPPAPERSAPEPAPPPSPSPTPTPAPAPPAETFRLDALSWHVRRPGAGDGAPTVRTGESSWLWQRPTGPRIGGTRYGHGATVPAPSSVTVDLNRPCTAYDALAGVDALTVGDRAVRFTVYGDGTPLWRSPVLRRGDPPAPLHVPLTGVETMRLGVDPVRPPDSAVQPVNRAAVLAAWADASISCR